MPRRSQLAQVKDLSGHIVGLARRKGRKERRTCAQRRTRRKKLLYISPGTCKHPQCNYLQRKWESELEKKRARITDKAPARKKKGIDGEKEESKNKLK